MQEVFPNCCIHFEDWKGTDAIRMLERYADKVLCYNDDIQGTASVALAGLETALQIVDAPLTEQRILFLGAGSAGIGIANLIVAAMQKKGLSQDEARGRVSMFDIDGLLEPSRAGLSDAQKVYAHKAQPSKDLVKTIETILDKEPIDVYANPTYLPEVLAKDYDRLWTAERMKRVAIALRVVGLAERARHYPRQLSGGQEQRVGIARAIVTDPTLLLCDEPTGDLDRKAGDEILDLLQALNRDHGKTIIMVTHDPHAADRARRTLHLEKGVLVDAEPVATR